MRRVLFSGSLLAAVLAVVFLAPFRFAVTAPALVELKGAHRIYVATSGALVHSVREGDQIAAGQVLAELENPELNRRIVQLTGEVRQLEIRIQNLKSQIPDEQNAASMLVAQERLTDVQRRLSQLQEEYESLTMLAPAAGTVVAPRALPDAVARDAELGRWTETPLAAANVGCFLERGTLFCLVADPAAAQAVLFVDDADVAYIKRRQQVRLTFDEAPGVVLRGEVEEIAQEDVADVPAELAVDQQVAHQVDASGRRRPLRTAYQIRVALDPHDAHLVMGARGRGKVLAPPQTLAQRLVRLIRETFKSPT